MGILGTIVKHTVGKAVGKAVVKLLSNPIVWKILLIAGIVAVIVLLLAGLVSAIIRIFTSVEYDAESKIFGSCNYDCNDSSSYRIFLFI